MGSLAEVDEPMEVVPELEAVIESMVAVLDSVREPMSSLFVADVFEAVEPMVVVVAPG